MKNIILFGTGTRGFKCLEKLKSFIQFMDDASSIKFTDNNKLLHHIDIKGIPVIPPSDLVTYNKDTTTIIICTGSMKSIHSQVRQYGFNDVFYFDNEDNIVPIDSASAVLDKLEYDIQRSDRIRNNYSHFETYKYIAKLKFDAGTLFDEPFFGFSRHLAEFQDMHKGQRCFIIGNGPSLNSTDVKLLKNEITFSSNLAYKAFDDWGFASKYWCVLDRLYWSQQSEEALSSIPSDTIKFMPADISNYVPPYKFGNIVPCNAMHLPCLQERFDISPFSLYYGGTVTMLAMQIAAIMGCNPIYLIGIDHNYDISSQEDLVLGYRTLLCQVKNSRNHFREDYNSNIFSYVPSTRKEDLDTPYKIIYEQLVKMGVEVYNASPDTKLDVIPKINYSDIFK